jgi:C-terminal processing protease CtpA/Prc
MTGLVGAAPAGAFDGRDWAVHVFSPAQYPYHDHVWTGPLIILVDQETWSAAEEFAAVLQDNRAAIVMGARTGGAGCGHTNGGTPTLLRNSGATLSLPDCVRLRADGSNEVRGIIPDVLVGLRADDGNRFRAGLVTGALAEAVARAKALHPGAE